MKRSFHNLTIYTRPLTNGNLSLWVRHKFGSGKYSYSKTDIVIPANSWDAKKKEVKSRQEFKIYRDKFTQLVNKRHELIDKLNLQEILPADALKQIQHYHISDSPELIASLNVNDLDTNQRIKMLQIVLQYTLPRMKQDTNEVSEDLPLFIE